MVVHSRTKKHPVYLNLHVKICKDRVKSNRRIVKGLRDRQVGVVVGGPVGYCRSHGDTISHKKHKNQELEPG